MCLMSHWSWDQGPGLTSQAPVRDLDLGLRKHADKIGVLLVEFDNPLDRLDAQRIAKSVSSNSASAS